MKIIILFPEITRAQELISASLQFAGQSVTTILGIFLKKKNQPKTYSQGFYDRQKSESEDLPMLRQIIDWAEEYSSASNANFTAIYGKEVSLAQIINQNSYSDLIVADAKTDFNDYLLTSMNASLKDMLVDAHCPVLLVRSNPNPIQQIIFTYDGSFSSMHAIKMFNYLLPASSQIPVAIVSVDSQRDDQKQNEILLDDWLKHHYVQVQKEAKRQNIKEQLLEIANRSSENIYLVMSAYSKEAYARVFHPSHVHLLLNYSNLSLFIAHE
jgi:hypothetical protein